MENRRTTYRFVCEHDDANIDTTLEFTVPAAGTHIATLHDMCKRFALALGYADSNVEEYFGDSGCSFEEFII